MRLENEKQKAEREAKLRAAEETLLQATSKKSGGGGGGSKRTKTPASPEPQSNCNVI